MLRTGDKIKYAKENSMICIPLGTIFTVTDVTVKAIYMDTEMELGGMKGVAKCVMSYDEYEKYFEKVVEEPKPTWTEWRQIKVPEMYELFDESDNYYFVLKYLKHYLSNCPYGNWETRNNGKKTEVRYHIAGQTYKGVATCNKEFDEFNESQGIKVALLKLFVKRIAFLSSDYIKVCC